MVEDFEAFIDEKMANLGETDEVIEYINDTGWELLQDAVAAKPSEAFDKWKIFRDSVREFLESHYADEDPDNYEGPCCNDFHCPCGNTSQGPR